MTVVYRNRDKKSASLRRIAEYMSGTGVRKKIGTLTNQHQREVRQVRQSMKSGAGTQDSDFRFQISDIY